MKTKLILTATLFCVTLCVPLSLFSQDFEMNGTVLVKYNGSAANVTIPAGVTAIGDEAFRNNGYVISVTIPEGVISIGYNAFSTCRNLTSIIVDTRNSAYSSVDGVLFNKDKTILITYPGGKQDRTYTIPRGVKSIESWAFSECIFLTRLIIPASVTSIEDFVFHRCLSLVSITVNILNSAYSSVDGVLFNKDKTILITYPEARGGVYTIPTGVITIGNYAFTNGKLTRVIIQEGVISIGDSAFFNCYGLLLITIPSSVTSIGDSAFDLCTELYSITVDTRNSVYSSVDGILFNKNRTILIKYSGGKLETTYTIPAGVTSIGKSAFQSCYNITSVAIPEGVISIGNGAFWHCRNLESVTIPEGVISIENYAFAHCNKLINVTIPSSITSIGLGAFGMCNLPTVVSEDIRKRFGGDPFYSGD